jgi:DNA-binding NtrC family response regulator
MNRRRASKLVLVIEDDKTLNQLLVDKIKAIGHQAIGVTSWAEARARLERRDPSLAILDIRLPDANGMACLEELSAQCPVLVLTAYGTVEDAVTSIRAGAAEYLIKPINPTELDIVVNRVLDASSLKRSYEYCRDQLNPSISKTMIGQSPAFAEMVRMIELVAPSDSTILIQGESGVGKELVAKSIHQLSERRDENFVPIDSTTLQETLFESELFGHEKGAFTGADRRKRGLIEVAESGTLFLDEIGELPANMQAKLLRLLEASEFRRVGGTETLMSDTRVVAATNRDLRTQINEGAFRADLYYRLATVIIDVPPLRDRREDIPLLAELFLDNRNFQRAKPKQLAKDALKVLSTYCWPGNVRELRNVIERAVLISGDARLIQARDLGLDQLVAEQGCETEMHEDLSFDHEPTLEEIKQTYVSKLVTRYHGHRARIAKILGMSERNTYRLLKKYGLTDRDR